MPTRSIAASTAARSVGRRPVSGGSCGSRPSADDLLDRHRERQLGELRDDRDRARDGAPVERARSARRRARPCRTAGRRTPVSARSSVDLPAPFGPTSATRSPRASGQVAPATIAPLAVGDRDGRGGQDRRGGHSSYPERVRVSRNRKNGAPSSAITTPTGMSPDQPRDEVGGGQQHRPEDRGERDDPPRRRTDQQPHDVRHDQPDEPDQAADRDRRRRGQRGQRQQDAALAADVDAEVAGGGVAEQQPVERPGAEPDDDAVAPRISGAATASRLHDAPPRPPSRNEKISRRFGARTGTSPSSAARPGPSRPRSPVSSSRVSPPGPGRRRAGTRGGGQQGAGEGQAVDQRRTRRSRGGPGTRTRDRGPERGAGRRAQHVRVGERVADACPGTSRRRRRARRRRASRSAPAASAGPRRSSRSRPSRRARCRSRTVRHRMTPTVSPGPIWTEPSDTPATSSDEQGDDAERRDQPGRPRTRPARPTVPRSVEIVDADISPRHGAGGSVMSGYIASARLRSPVGRRGPGRVISVSLTGRMSPFLTAVRTLQPVALGDLRRPSACRRR